MANCVDGDGHHPSMFERTGSLVRWPSRRHSSPHLASAAAAAEGGEIMAISSPSLRPSKSLCQEEEVEAGTVGCLSSPADDSSDVNKRLDCLRRTPLIVAARTGDEQCLQKLLENPQVDINAAAKGGLTALHLACFCGHATIVQRLLFLESNVRSQCLEILSARTTEERFMPLHAAACAGNLAVFLELLKAFKLARLRRDALQRIANARDCIGWTPLHHAVWRGNFKVVNELLTTLIVNVNAADNDGFTPLHLASWQGYEDVVASLLSHLGEERFSDVKPNLLAGNNIDTMERISTSQQDVDWEHLPRPKLADFTIKEQRSKVTPLHYAVELNREGVVTQLLESAEIDVHQENSAQKSAFDLAMSEGKSELLWQLLGNYREKFDRWERFRNELSLKGIKNFIAKGHDPEEKRLNNCGELLKAAVDKGRNGNSLGNGNVEDIMFLLNELRIRLIEMNKPKLRNIKGEISLLHHAAFAGLEKLVEILAEIPGMELNDVDSEDQTPLHYAAYAGRATVVSVLIRKPLCRANAEDRFGKSALQIAVENGRRDVEKLLMELPDVRDYVDRLYRNRQVFVDAANTMLLGAALIAGISFAGWLQPPGGFTPYPDMEVPSAPPGTYYAYASVDQHLSMRVFWVFNSLSFFCAIATMIAGAGAVLPTLDVFIGKEVKFVKRTLVAASTLLVFSVVFILGAFGAAGYASLPPMRKYEKNMTFTVIFGVGLCMLSMVWFLKRLYGIRPSWWRRCENYTGLRLQKQTPKGVD